MIVVWPLGAYDALGLWPWPRVQALGLPLSSFPPTPSLCVLPPPLYTSTHQTPAHWMSQESQLALAGPNTLAELSRSTAKNQQHNVPRFLLKLYE